MRTLFFLVERQQMQQGRESEHRQFAAIIMESIQTKMLEPLSERRLGNEIFTISRHLRKEQVMTERIKSYLCSGDTWRAPLLRD